MLQMHFMLSGAWLMSNSVVLQSLVGLIACSALLAIVWMWALLYVMHVSGGRVVCVGRLFARALNCRLPAPSEFATRALSLSCSGSCVAYLNKTELVYACDFIFLPAPSSGA
jgi:hypothetical protein